MKKLISELIQIEEKRNSLLAEISESLKNIASKGNSTNELFKQLAKEAQQHQNEVGKSAFKV